MSQGRKLLLDLGPLLAFFIANWKFGIFWATGIFMAATFLSLIITYAITRHLNKFLLVSAVFVGVFGGLTLYFQDATFIKVKVTLANLSFAGALLGGLYYKRLFIRDIMGEAMELPDAAWKTLTLRWALFFIAMAALNIAVWQLFSESTWVTFKSFGLLGFTMLFALANAPFMAKHMKDEDADKTSSAD